MAFNFDQRDNKRKYTKKIKFIFSIENEKYNKKKKLSSKTVAKIRFIERGKIGCTTQLQ